MQAREERNYHVFYELLAGMNDWDKQELYLQGAETYYYLNQVCVPLTDAENVPSFPSFSTLGFRLHLSQGRFLWTEGQAG